MEIHNAYCEIQISDFRSQICNPPIRLTHSPVDIDRCVVIVKAQGDGQGKGGLGGGQDHDEYGDELAIEAQPVAAALQLSTAEGNEISRRR